MKNSLHRFVAILLVLFTVASLCTGTLAANMTSTLYGKYDDVPAGAWYERYANAVRETGIMNGTGEGQFSPMANCTRAMFVTILYRLAGEPAVKAASTMKDVVAGSWYANAVAWAQESGVTTGYADGNFGVNDTLNRQQMVTFLHRFAKYMGKDVTKTADISAFADAASVQNWAKEAISWAVGEGVIQGSDKGLEPTSACTRAMAATVISRLNGLVDEQITREEMEKAIVETAFSYYMKGEKIQYGGRALDEGPGKWFGGTWRLQLYTKTEDATSDYELFSVCSDFMYSVYDNAFNYPLFGARVNQIVRSTWKYSAQPDDMALIRWVSPTYNNSNYSEEDISLGMKTKLSTTEEVLAFLADYEKNLRPGDVFTYYTPDASSGHNLMYIGNGYILDSSGRSYDMASGADDREANGTVTGMETVQEIFLDSKGSYNIQKLVDDKIAGFFTVIRPLNALCIDDGDGNPANDKLNNNYVLKERSDLLYDANTRKSGFTINNATRSRLKYPAMEIDRTVNRTPYGTTFTGDTLTYSIVISNKSNEANYTKYHTAERGTAYTGEDYKGLVVKETIPAGTELVSVPEGAVLNGRTLTWTVNLASGKSVTLAYNVKVTAKQGETIVSGNGWVDKIPSTIIENYVGGTKLSAEKLASLKEFTAAGVDKWNSNEGYKISAKSANTKFAMRIYNEAMGLDLKLPDAQELVDNLFAYTELFVEDGYGAYKGKSDRSYMLMLRDEVPAGYETIRKMVIPSYVGGLGVHVDRYAGDARINSFRSDYHEPGDIIVLAKLDGTPASATKRNVTETVVLVYLGDGSYATLNDANELQLVNDDVMLWKAFSYDFFVGLRPTMGYADINTEVKAYDKSKSPALTEEDKNAALDPWSQEALKNNLANLTKSAWSGARSPSNQRTFARWVYKICNLDISDKVTQNISYTIGGTKDTGLFEKENGMYVPQAEPSANYAGEKAMLVHKAWGGLKAVDGDPTKMDSSDDFLVGDMIFMYKLVGEDNYYGCAVALGDDRFFHSIYSSGVTQSNEADFYSFAGLQNKMNSDGWEIYYVLRPSQAYVGNTAAPDTGAQTEITKSETETTTKSFLESTKWNLYYVLRPSQAVSGLDMTAHAEKLKALTPADWETGGKGSNQRSFGQWVYKTFGVDLTTTLTQNISYTCGHASKLGTALFEHKDGTYTKTTGEISESFVGEGKMYVEGMFGGTSIEGGDKAKMTSLESYQPGDLLSLLYRVTDEKFVYGVGVYLGDGKFLTADSSTKKAQILTFEQMQAVFEQK